MTPLERAAVSAALRERDRLRRMADPHGVTRGVMTPATIARVPNQPKTPLKSFRIPEGLYVAAQAKAAERGESVSEVVRKALERYVKRP